MRAPTPCTVMSPDHVPVRFSVISDGEVLLLHDVAAINTAKSIAIRLRDIVNDLCRRLRRPIRSARRDQDSLSVDDRTVLSIGSRVNAQGADCLNSTSRTSSELESWS